MHPAPAIVRPISDTHLELARRSLASRNVLEAIEHFAAAERAGSLPNDCAAGLWECWMLLGEFENAWAESDRIARLPRDETDGLWDGTQLSGRRVLIRCLHGLGDSIQFIRYVRLLKSMGSTVFVETHTELVRLFRNVTGIEKVVSWADGSSKDFHDWDCQIEVMQLPYAFRTAQHQIPVGVPYLRASVKDLAASAQRLTRKAGKLNVGIIWGSSEWNPARSIPVCEFSALAKLTNVAVFSFQRGPKRDELRLFDDDLQVFDTAQGAPDIADTAADMMNMDLIISVDTMACHLAGALGLNTWTLLPFEADWRWMLNADVTPWYPTMRLFRQTKPGDWSEVVKRVTRLVAELN